MKGLILKDILQNKKNRNFMFVMLVMFGVFSYVSKTNLLVMISFFAMTRMLTTLSYDEYYKWDVYAIALPGGRREIVKAKYCVALLTILVFSILGFLGSLVIMILDSTITMDETVSALFGSLVASLGMIALVLPAYYKFGVEKSRMFIAIAAVLVVLFVMLVGNLATGVQGTIAVSDGVIILIICVILLLLLVMSYRISQNIYAKKDF